VAIFSIGATNASAATEVGNGCEGNNVSSAFPVISLANAPVDPLPAAIPASGVITQWKSRTLPSGVPQGELVQALEVFRPTSTPKSYVLVGESSPANIFSGGPNTFPTRIPVQAGDRLGLVNAGGTINETLFCSTPNTGDVIGVATGPASLNAPLTFPTEKTSAQVPAIATVERDADGDGFGDETQDACPQSAAFQIPCPAVDFTANNIVSKGSVQVLVSTTTTAPVTVSGVVKLGHGKVAKLKAGSKTVAPGQIVHFRLKFPKSLKAKLKEMSRGQLLNLKVRVSATNVAGTVVKKSSKVFLRGQG
jgi:hypothetical protein